MVFDVLDDSVANTLAISSNENTPSNIQISGYRASAAYTLSSRTVKYYEDNGTEVKQTDTFP